MEGAGVEESASAGLVDGVVRPFGCLNLALIPGIYRHI